MMSDYEHMRDRMIYITTQMSRMDVKQAPNYRMMLALRDAFVAHGVPTASAEHLVAAMKISVCEQAMNDAELVRRVCEAFGGLIGEMYKAIRTDFETQPDQILLSMASQLSVTMEV